MDYYIFQDDSGTAVKTDIDLSLTEEALQQKRGWLLWIFVKIKSPNEMLWCGEDECSILSDMKKYFGEHMENGLDAVLAAVRMQDGWQEFYFYAPSAKKFENYASEVMRSFGGYAYEVGSAKDAKWDKYLRELYPDELMLQQMQSRHIIKELEDAGDFLEKEREVEHYLFFQTSAQAQRAELLLQESGYKIKNNIEQEGDYFYGITVVKEHAATEEVLMHETSKMIQVATDEHGIYEGWSTVLAQ